MMILETLVMYVV